MSEETNKKILEKLEIIIELLQRTVKWLDDIESKLSEIEDNTAR